MKPIRQSIEVARRPEDVFSYATDFARFPEWQVGAVTASPIGDSPAGPGARAAVTRKVGPARFARTEVISRYHPPRTWTVEGVGGPLTAHAHGTIEPGRDGAGSQVTSSPASPGSRPGGSSRRISRTSSGFSNRSDNGLDEAAGVSQMTFFRYFPTKDADAHGGGLGRCRRGI
jgi:hypothetical protein